MVGVKGQSQYHRASALLEGVQHVLQSARINLVSALIALSYFTDTSVYSPTLKNRFLKCVFSHCRLLFLSCDCQNFYWKIRKLAGVFKESVFREKKGDAST